MTGIVKRGSRLPDTIPELNKFVLVGKERLKVCEAEIRAIKITDLGKQVRDQKLEEAQGLAKILIKAEARLGQLLAGIPDFHSSGRGTMKRKEMPSGITKKQSHYAQELSRYPEIEKEVVNQIIGKYDIPKRSDILKAIQKKKRESKGPPELPEGDVQLLSGDIFDRIKDIEDRSIDLLIADPPYGIMDDYKWDSIGDFDNFTETWIKAVLPKLKKEHIGFIFMDARQMYHVHAILSKHIEIKGTIIWIRKNLSMGRVVKDRFISSYEIIFYFGNSSLRLPETWGKERFDSIEFAVPQSNFNEPDKKHHPTQKPYGLIEHLVNVGSDPGATVLDCFAGSGVTGIACRRLGRSGILIEQDEGYIETIKNRGIA